MHDLSARIVNVTCYRLWFLVALLGLVGSQVNSAAVEVIAHRGNSSAAPENTLAAIHSAFDVGADHVEVDIRLTSDGHAVLMHDSSVERTTDASGLISNMTWDEVSQLDAGSWFGPEFAGEPVPRLADALVAVGHRGRILLDIKVGGMGSSIQAALDEASAAIGGSFTGDDLWIWPGPNADYETNVLDPQYLLGSLPSVSQWQSPGYFEGLLDQQILGFDTGGGVTPDFATAARSHGLVVSVYTINSESAMQFWIDQGVSAMETDYPEVLFDLLASELSVDFDGNGLVDGADWLFFVAHLGVPDPGPTDLTGDGFNNHADFVLFKQFYDEFNGTGSFDLMLATVPEPSALVLLLPVIFFAMRNRRH